MKTVILIAAGILAIFLLFTCEGVTDCGPITKAKSEVQSLAFAIQHYCDDHNDTEAMFGKEPVQLIHADEITGILTMKADESLLLAKNPKGIRYLEWPKEIQKDPWGNSYLIALNKSKGRVDTVFVWSAGQNRLNEFGQGDDISSIRFPSQRF